MPIRRASVLTVLSCGGSISCSAGNKLARLLIAVLALTLTMGRPATAASDRVALILSTQEYTVLNASAIAVKDAEQINAALSAQGFETTLVKNPSDAVGRASLRDFANKAKDANVALVILTGHGIAYDGRTYFVPANAEILRPTDLLSRALSVASVAQIAGRARTGAVFFFMTVANLPSTLASLSSRPSGAETDANVVVVYSTSDKIPVSTVDKTSEQAVREFAKAATEKQLRLSTLMAAAQANGVGKVVGKVADISLLAPPPSQAKETSERVSEAEQRAREAEARAQKAEEAARQEAKKAEAAMKAAADQQAKQQAAQQQAAQQAAQQKASETPAVAPKAPEDTKALELVEQMFGPLQRKQIQIRLKRLGFYKGPIDALFLELTRQAIKDYQESIKETVTGYLTPTQVQALLKVHDDTK